MFAAPIWKSWATSIELDTQLHMPFWRQRAEIHVCLIFHDIIDHQSDEPNSFPWKWTNLCAMLSFNTWQQQKKKKEKREKRGYVKKPLLDKKREKKRKKAMLKKPFMNFMMKTRLRLWGRKLCPTAWSNSNQQNLEVEGQHSRWPTSWDLRLPQTKKWLSETVTKLRLTDDWLSDT